MAALFLPLATISSVFGMNISHGFERSTQMFWFVLLVGVVMGVGIGTSVLKLRSLNPEDW